MNRIFKFGLLVALSFSSLYSCEEDALEPVTIPEAISFDDDLQSIEVIDDNTTYDLVVQSTTVSDVDRSYQIMVTEATTAEDNQFDVSTSITIPAGQLTGSIPVTFNYDALEFGDVRNINFELMLADGTTPNLARQNFQLSFVKKCTLNDVTLAIVVDDYPEETYWQLYDVSVTPAVLLMEEGTFAGTASGSTLTFKLCLDAGNYGIFVGDTYGDGIVNGGFTVTANGTIVADSAVAGGGSSAVFDLN